MCTYRIGGNFGSEQIGGFEGNQPIFQLSYNTECRKNICLVSKFTEVKSPNCHNLNNPPNICPAKISSYMVIGSLLENIWHIN